VPSTLPQGLKDPPSYTPVPRAGARTVVQAGPPPPPYVTDPGVVEEDEDEEEGDGEELDEKELLRREEAREEKRRAKAAVTSTPTPPRDFDPDDEKAEPAEDTLHFVDHEHDSINSLSLRYNVPATALRRANNITSDHLLLARRTVVIPGEFYKAGVSLSPRPIGGEEEEQRKGRIRRFMTSCKVADYDVALLYLEQTGYDVEAAADAYFDDEAWERAHPGQSSSSRKEGTSKKPSLWSRLRK
jgi:LysM repeat protein